MAALCVGVVLVLAAATGPTGLVQDSGRDGSATQPTLDADSPADDGRSDDVPQSVEHSDEDPAALGGWVRDVLSVVLLVLLLWVTAGVVRYVAHRVARDLPLEQLVLDLEPLPDVETAREAVRRGGRRYDEVLAASEVRNGIVACWVLLEETATAVGLARGPAETATEFVVRFLHLLDVDPRPVATLAALYHEARFSTHTMPADARTRAQEALDEVRAEVVRSPAP